MLDSLPTAYLFIAGALILLALPKGPIRGAFLLAIPALAAWQVWTLPEGSLHNVQLFGLTLEMMRVDKLARVFGLIFWMPYCTLPSGLGRTVSCQRKTARRRTISCSRSSASTISMRLALGPQAKRRHSTFHLSSSPCWALSRA